MSSPAPVAIKRSHSPDAAEVLAHLLEGTWQRVLSPDQEVLERLRGVEEHFGVRVLPEGFEGTPLRKSFVLAARATKPWPGGKEPGEGHGGRRSPSRRTRSGRVDSVRPTSKIAAGPPQARSSGLARRT